MTKDTVESKPRLNSSSVSRAILVGIFLITLCIPLIVMNTGVVTPIRLQNLTKPKNPGLPNWERLVDGSYQRSVAIWFLRRHGLWGHLVRLDNQLNLQYFDQISAKYAAALKVARGGWLFQSLYLDHFNRVSLPAQEQLEARALALKRLQELLAKRGIGLLVVISSGKIEPYPQLVPWQYRAPKRLSRPSTYDRTLPLLRQLQIPVLDSVDFFRSRAPDDPQRYYTPSGSHWNDVGACELVQEIIQRMEQHLQKPLKRIACAPVIFRPKPNDTDLDLVIMANLWDRTRYLQPTPYPDAHLMESKTSEVFQPRLLVVGTSFSWSLLRFLDQFRVPSEANFWYYFRRVRHYPTKRQHPLDRAKIDWQRDLLEVDYVIIETSIATLDNTGFEFLGPAIEALSQQDAGEDGGEG